MCARQASHFATRFVENIERFQYLLVLQGQIEYVAAWLNSCSTK
jgi:hypothetical protein